MQLAEVGYRTPNGRESFTLTARTKGDDCYDIELHRGAPVYERPVLAQLELVMPRGHSIQALKQAMRELAPTLYRMGL